MYSAGAALTSPYYKLIRVVFQDGMAGLGKPLTDTSTGKTCLHWQPGDQVFSDIMLARFSPIIMQGAFGIGVDDLGHDGGVSDAQFVYPARLQEVVDHNLGNRRR